MIYMREKAANKKREDGKNDRSRRLIIDQLKSQLNKKNNALAEGEKKKENENRKNYNDANEHLKINQTGHAPVYKISKSQDLKASQEKFSESIIIHDTPHNPNPIFSKKTYLNTVKCFDIQILNDLSSSRYRAQAYIQMLQRDREIKNKQILNLKGLLTAPPDAHSKKQLQSLKLQLSQQQTSLDKYRKYFQEGKNLYLSVVMELIDTKNELDLKLSEERKRSKERSINKSIQRIEKLISVYSSFLQFKLKKQEDDTINMDELWNNVKYQQKIIQILKENESNYQLKKYYHQNSLLRYQINRLSDHNQELLGIISNSKDNQSLSFDHQPRKNQPQTINHNPERSIKINQGQSSYEIDQSNIQEISEHYSSQIQKDQTPFNKIKPQFSPPQISHPFSNSEADHLLELNGKLEKEVKEHKKRIGILQIQKEYILDQLQQLQKTNSNVQSQIKELIQQNSHLKEQIAELQNINELNQEQQKAVEEQNELLKDKVDHLFKTNGKKTATVEQLLKLLNRKQLSNYHQALMELISRYEIRISELTNSYTYERQHKQRSLTYCMNLLNIVQTKRNSNEGVKLQQIINYISQYKEIIQQLKQNEIDAYLRKIKAFSIGIDEQAIDTIKEELKDYVYQLQIRLPTLSEEYFQDGSSIANSFNNSIDRFD